MQHNLRGISRKIPVGLARLGSEEGHGHGQGVDHAWKLSFAEMKNSDVPLA